MNVARHHLRLTHHARRRMRERGVTRAMVRLVLRYGTRAAPPPGETGARIRLLRRDVPPGEDEGLWIRTYGLVVARSVAGWVTTVFWEAANG